MPYGFNTNKHTYNNTGMQSFQANPITVTIAGA